MKFGRSPGRILALTGLTALVVGSAAALAPGKKSVQWQTNLKKAETTAASQKKILMVDFYADW